MIGYLQNVFAVQSKVSLGAVRHMVDSLATLQSLQHKEFASLQEEQHSDSYR